MIKKIIMTATLSGIFMTAPLFASADSISEIQAQIQSLFSQIQKLQSQLTVMQAETNTQGSFSSGDLKTNTKIPPTGGIMNPVATTSTENTDQATGNSDCINLSSGLARGSRGAEVSRLQHYLNENGLLADGSVSGYYGSATEQAVVTMQTKLGIFGINSDHAAGRGVFGPVTSSALHKQCTQSTQTGGIMNPVATTQDKVPGTGGFFQGPATKPVNSSIPPTGGIMNPVATTTDKIPGTGGFFQGPTTVINTPNTILAVSSQSGTVPLTVSFTITTGGVNGQPIYINFGDGSAAFMITSSAGSGSCAFGVLCGAKLNQYSVTHSYTSAGSFTAKILSSSSVCTGNTCSDAANSSSSALATAVITTFSATNSDSGTFHH